MSMEDLPHELENIVNEYKEQMEFLDNRVAHKERFKSTLDRINKISYSVTRGDSWRTIPGKCLTQYYGGLNHAETLYKSTYELWVHTYTQTLQYMNIGICDEDEIIKTIYESSDYVEICDNS